MFWHRKKTKDLSLLIFSAIALLIIVFTVLITMVFLSKVKQGDNTISQQVQEYVTETSDVLLTKKYFNELQGLYVTIESEDQEVYDSVEKVFFSVRVPEEMLDNHLQTFLQINNLKEKRADKSEVLKLLDNLIKKIEPNEEIYN